MRWTARRNDVNIPRLTCQAILACGVAWLSSGCQLIVNPFVDDYACTAPVVTPSVVGVQEAGATPTSRQRGFSEVVAQVEDGAISHSPLLFEDGGTDNWTDDGVFAWTDTDWVQWLAWRARFLINTATVGISWMTTPPWAVMESDGVPSRCLLGQHYDAGLQ